MPGVGAEVRDPAPAKDRSQPSTPPFVLAVSLCPVCARARDNQVLTWAELVEIEQRLEAQIKGWRWCEQQVKASDLTPEAALLAVDFPRVLDLAMQHLSQSQPATQEVGA